MAYGGFWRRFLAYLIDIVPIAVLSVLLFLIVLGPDLVLQSFEVREIYRRGHFSIRVENHALRSFIFLVYILYAAYLESSPRQATFGKQLLGLYVTDTAGRRLTFPMALIRNLAKILSAAACLIGFLWAGFHPRKQAWHDLLAGALVRLR